MAFCEECGTCLPKNCVVCPACGAAIASDFTQSAESTSCRAAAPVTSATTSRCGSELLMAENEQIVRQYQCSQIRRPRCEGYLIVTNKRLLFQGKGATSRVSKEAVLDSVSGLDCFYGMNISVPRLIIGILLAIVGLMLLSKRTTDIL